MTKPKREMQPAQRIHILEESLRRKNTLLSLAEQELSSIKRANDTAASIKAEIYNIKNLTPSPPKWLLKKIDPRLPGVPMVALGDWHWGEHVDPAQVGGVNEFNPDVAKRRTQLLAQRLLDLVLRHMVKPQYPGIVCCLVGDMITGAIHEDLTATNDQPVMCSIQEVQEALITLIQILHDNFGNVFIPCVVGNHGRNTVKPRVKNRVFESYEWNLYQNLKLYFRNNPNIVFYIPDETDAYFQVLGHRFLLTHGDTLGVRGGDGIIGALGPIARGAIKVGASEARIGRDFDTIIMGHWHIYMPRGDTVPVVVNGPLIGYNEYARLVLRVPYSRPMQALWFLHQEQGFTAQWPIYLDEHRQATDFAEWVSWQQRRK